MNMAANFRRRAGPPRLEHNFTGKKAGMNLSIDSSLTVQELQDRFRHSFPDLKLEFFFHGTEELNLAAGAGRSFSQTRIRDLCRRCGQEHYSVSGQVSIGQLEGALKEKFGLPARIYVLQDGYWVKSSRHDQRPLENSRQPIRLS